MSEAINSKVSNKVRIFGFTFLKNGVKLDYPFKESLKSLEPLCQKIYLAHGDSDDSTGEELKEFNSLVLISTAWDGKLREGGLILSQQTNLILDKLREVEIESDENPAWGIYLQADEVLHEQDYERIKEDIEKAEEHGCDVIRFRYHHFWQSHHHVAINKKWYPQEIRAVKLNSKVESWGDAQSFRGFMKVYESDAFIYHYGHVREEESYKLKKKEFLSLYADAKNIAKYTKRSEKKDANTEVLEFWGNHPVVMEERVVRLGEKFSLEKKESIIIVGDKDRYSKYLVDKVNAENVFWVKKTAEIKEVRKGWSSDLVKNTPVVLTRPSFWNRLIYNGSLHEPIPRQMRSPLARPWLEGTLLMFQLSAQRVGLKP